LSMAVGETLKTYPAQSPTQIGQSWVEEHPEAQGYCLARPEGKNHAHGSSYPHSPSLPVQRHQS
jgi:hypothetical protein